jgi:hypothetical protein
MSDEEPHDGQESATMHCGSARARASGASECGIERSAMESERGRGIRRKVESDLRQSEHRCRRFG